jgi:hypothetical protein
MHWWVARRTELRTGLSVQHMPPVLLEEDETPLLLEPFLKVGGLVMC